MRSATITVCCGSVLPASEVRAPFGMRTAIGGMCSKESGMESKRIFTAEPLHPPPLRGKVGHQSKPFSPNPARLLAYHRRARFAAECLLEFRHVLHHAIHA